MAAGLILLTGASGQVGYRVLIEALTSGYHVRATVRKESSITDIKATESIQPYLSQVEFVLVEDITKEGGFDNVVKDVDYIIHVASPFLQQAEDLQAALVTPAVQGTVGLLHSALHHGSKVQRIVITSSVLAVLPLSAFQGKDPGILTPTSYVPDPQGPYDNHFIAYTAGKTLAYNRTLDFIKNEKPHFTVINILPTFVLGKNELAKTKAEVNSGSNAVALVPLLGGHNPDGAFSVSVHIDDLAYIHVASLSSNIKGNRNFAANCNGMEGIKWDDAINIVKKKLPQAIAEGTFPLGGSQASNLLRFNASETESVLKMKFKGFEEQITSLAEWYIQAST